MFKPNPGYKSPFIPLEDGYTQNAANGVKEVLNPDYFSGPDEAAVAIEYLRNPAFRVKTNAGNGTTEAAGPAVAPDVEIHVVEQQAMAEIIPDTATRRRNHVEWNETAADGQIYTYSKNIQLLFIDINRWNDPNPTWTKDPMVDGQSDIQYK